MPDGRDPNAPTPASLLREIADKFEAVELERRERHRRASDRRAAAMREDSHCPARDKS